MVYDIVIIGGGVAGMTAGIYAGRAKKSVLIVENSNLGGYTAQLKKIENYPGMDNVDGIDLVMNMYNQTIKFGVEYRFEDISSIDFKTNRVQLDGDVVEYKTLIIAKGTSANKINCDNENKFKNKGVSYCAVCDGSLYANKNIVCITNGNIGKHDIDYLKNITKSLHVLDIGEKFTDTSVNCVSNVKVVSIDGDKKVSGINYDINGITNHLDCDAIFVSLGKHIDLSLFNNQIATKDNFILSDENMKTNIDNVFVAGDVRYKKLRQIVTACADGAIAATSAMEYINKN